MKTSKSFGLYKVQCLEDENRIFCYLKEVYSAVFAEMQIRSLFAVLFLSFAVVIGFPHGDDDFVPLEERSVEELARIFIKNTKSSLSKLHGDELEDAEVDVIFSLPRYLLELLQVDLPVDQFCDFILQTMLNDYKNMTPSELAAERKKLLLLVKKAPKDDSKNQSID
uniref:Uncharacterized protein n=1 Tax=Panagrellus redivivus TaxID=6233 RepID=A0A7E4VMA3_PANRE